MLLLQSLTDSWQLQWNGGLLQPSAIARTLRGEAKAQVAEFALNLSRSDGYQTVAAAGLSVGLGSWAELPKPHRAAFSPVCWVHGVVTGDAFFDTLVQGRSARDVLQAAVEDGLWQSAVQEDTAHCSATEWNCSVHCPAHWG